MIPPPSAHDRPRIKVVVIIIAVIKLPNLAVLSCYGFVSRCSVGWQRAW